MTIAMQNLEQSFFPKELEAKLQKIKLAIFDIDGVFTDGHLYYTAQGETIKAFSVLDGHGIKILKRNKIKVAIISGKKTEALLARMKDLQIEDLHCGVDYKLPIYEQLLKKYNLSKDEVCYMGDDIPDYPILKNCGLSVCAKNSHAIILNTCDWVIDIVGGSGAVRQLCDAIIIAKFGIDELLNQEKT